MKVCRGAVRGGALLVALAVGAAPSLLMPARASAADADRSGPATARHLVAEGDAFFARRDAARALERYAEAYRVMRVPTVGVEVVKAQKALGKLMEATQTACEVAALPEQPGEPAVFHQARLQAARDVVTLSAMTPTLLLDVAPRGVLFTVQIDGDLPALQTPFPLDPGPHRVRVSADGYQGVDQDVTLQEAERQTLTVTLFPDPAHATPVPSASGAPVGRATNSGAASAAAESKAAPPPVRHRPHASGGRTLGWVGMGIAGAGVAAGAFAGINALQTKPDCPKDVCSPDQRKDIRNSKQMGTIADVSFGVAIVAGALGIWQLATTSSGDDDAESAALPGTGPLAVDLGTGLFELRWSGGF